MEDVKYDAPRTPEKLFSATVKRNKTPIHRLAGIMSQTIAIIYLVIIAIVIIFQFCLIAGAPWGRITQGGQHDGPLPVSGRVAAGVSVFLLLFMGAGVSSAAGMLPNLPMWTAYTALAIQALSTLLNWITPSRPERLLWGPITTGMLSLAAYVILAS